MLVLLLFAIELIESSKYFRPPIMILFMTTYFVQSKMFPLFVIVALKYKDDNFEKENVYICISMSVYIYIYINKHIKLGVVFLYMLYLCNTFVMKMLP